MPAWEGPRERPRGAAAGWHRLRHPGSLHHPSRALSLHGSVIISNSASHGCLDARLSGDLGIGASDLWYGALGGGDGTGAPVARRGSEGPIPDDRRGNKYSQPGTSGMSSPEFQSFKLGLNAMKLIRASTHPLVACSDPGTLFLHSR